MSNDVALSAAAAILGGIVGGALSGVFQFAVSWWMDPKLELSFEDRREFAVESTYSVGGAHRTSTHVRVRLINKGKSIARDCRVYLTNITEIDGTRTHETALYDSKVLPWAGFPDDSNYRDIPPTIKLYADAVRFSKNSHDPEHRKWMDDPEWNFCFGTLFASQDSIRTYMGTYRLKVAATSANAKPTSIEFEVTYTGIYTSLRVSRA